MWLMKNLRGISRVCYENFRWGSLPPLYNGRTSHLHLMLCIEKSFFLVFLKTHLSILSGQMPLGHLRGGGGGCCVKFLLKWKL